MSPTAKTFSPNNLPNLSDGCLAEGPQLLQVANIVFATGAETFDCNGAQQAFRQISALRSMYVNSVGLTAGTVRLSFNNGLYSIDVAFNKQLWVPVYVPVPFDLSIISPLTDARGSLAINLYNFRVQAVVIR